MINLYALHNRKEKLDSYGLYYNALDNLLECDTYPDEIIHIIKKDSNHSYLYAFYVIGGRWIEAEHYIMKNSIDAFYYARNVIKGRWEEAEANISKDNYWWSKYCREFDIDH